MGKFFSESSISKEGRGEADRKRHRELVKDAIKKNIADTIAEQSIIGKSGDKIFKIPIRGKKEYQFIRGDKSKASGQGDGNSQPGDIIQRGRGQDQKPGQAGNEPGIDYYETDITLEELIELMFEDLELPDLQQKRLRSIIKVEALHHKGVRRKGIRPHLEKKKTAKERIRRKKAQQRAEQLLEEIPEEAKEPVTDEEEARFPFHEKDLRYRHMEETTRPESNAVIFAIMDVSGSMDMTKKYLARSFYFLLYQFIKLEYEHAEIVFIAHHTQAKVVSENEFFYKGESGGTFISSGYLKALELIQTRYRPENWNIYVLHCSDGDNWSEDNDRAIKALLDILEVANLFGYAEIKPLESRFYSGEGMVKTYQALIDPDEHPNFAIVQITQKEELWPAFESFFNKRSERGVKT